MFNLNIPPCSLLGSEGATLCSTPKTPEILNSLIAMTNPLDNYNFGTNSAILPSASISANTTRIPPLVVSYDNSHSSSSVSPLQSPAGANITPSVQQTCSQLIRAGLKLSIQSKRKLSSCESSSGNEQSNNKYRPAEDDCDETTDEEVESKILRKGLTPEDEDRRRRRRERNKIAATKCRMKKRERTNNLIKESEQLDNQNVELKTQVRALELERRKLVDMLQSHKTNCVHENRRNLPLKFQKSLASKYLDELDLEEPKIPVLQKENLLQKNIRTLRNQQRTAIPPMSTIKLSHNNVFQQTKNSTTMSLESSNISQNYDMLSSPLLALQPLRDSYGKASPHSQEIDFFKPSSQEDDCTQVSNASLKVNALPISSNNLDGQIPELITNNDRSMVIASQIKNLSSEHNSLIISDFTLIESSTDFVKNELVESESPYTTAQSAERFLFESNCENFIDIKQTVNSNYTIQESIGNNSSNSIEFHSPVTGTANLPAPFNESLSLKNDFLHEADLLAQLTGDGSEFVDLDTSVASVFLSNGGCLA